MLARWRFGEGEVVLLGTVQGLVAEGERVRRAMDEVQPAIVALGMSPESASALARYAPTEGHDPFADLPDHDFVYSRELARFGDVALPPPDALEAVRLAQERGLASYGVDLPEEAYETLFTQSVGAWGFLRYGSIQRKLAKRPPRAEDARAFSLAWDAAIRKVGGIAVVEREREAHIADAAARLAVEKAARVLLVVDVSREAGVAEQLAAASSSPQSGQEIGR